MFKIKNLTAKNFMSIGNATQSINFDRGDLTLVLGENLDLGTDGSRNGTGKTTIINALSYALYGVALTSIKRDNLINKTNGKNMLVSVDFEHDGSHYRVERGRKPAVLKFYRDDVDLTSNEEDESARGDSRDTNKEIIAVHGISHDMFKHMLALNTYTEPFLALGSTGQKNIIEQLLGITVLTEKAMLLKETNKQTKANIKEEEFRIAATIKANEHIEEQIRGLERRQALWQKSFDENIKKLSSRIEELMDVDIEAELEAHEQKKKYNADAAEIAQCNKWIDSIETQNKRLERDIMALDRDLVQIKNHKCHACGQELHDDKQEENKKHKEEQIEKKAMQILTSETQLAEHKLKLAEIGDIGECPVTIYANSQEAFEHKNTLEHLSKRLEDTLIEKDPYSEQIEEMQNKGLQEISYDELNRLSTIQEHQTFLLNLLTSKDSFIRKKIIEQNLNYLNSRLTYYLDEIGLPHNVKFLSDLSVEITELGRDLDFGNLSRGERNRLILSLSWAFRDVWESLYSHINLLFIDELIDSGLDTNGVEAAIKILKRMARERHKSVWLVSHRDELASRVHNTMTVIKESGFTTYEGGE